LLEPRITRHHEWLAAERDLDGDGLIWIVQPDESGLDSSPQFDPIWRERAHARPLFVRLVRRNRRLEYDLQRIVAAGGPVCCEVMTNVLYGLSRLALNQPSITRANRAVLATKPSGAQANSPDHLDLVIAAGASGSTRADRPAPGRGASARSGAVLDARAAGVRVGS
jgi:hypothetical protein